MIVKLDSVLHRIPTALNRRQALFLEGICFSIEMADLAHTRLRETLIRMAEVQKDAEDSPSTVSAMLDAWSIVDSLHRLRGLIQNMPRIEKRNRIPAIRAFFDSTQNIVPLRNTVQHLDTDISKILDDKNWAVLGSLSWAVIYPDRNEVVTYAFIPGVAMGSHPLVNPMNREVWHLPVDSITIERSGVAVCLSDAMRRVEVLVAQMEKMLAESYQDQIPEPKKHHCSGLIIALRMAIHHKQVLPEDTLDPEPETLPEDITPEESVP